MAELKPGWRRVKFGDVVRLNKETCKDPEAEGIERVLGLEHLEPGDLRIRTWGYVADGTTFTNRVRPGQVLFGKRRAYQRKVALVDFEAVCSGDIYVLESADADRLNPQLLPFICKTDAFFEHAVGTSAGSLSPRTNWKSLAEYEFMLPPIDEQYRLARLCSSLEAVSQSCKYACDRLEEAFRSSLRTHMSAGIGELPEMPNGRMHLDGNWRVSALGEIAIVQRGMFSHRPRNLPEFFGGRYPFAQTGDVAESRGYLGRPSQALSEQGKAYSKSFPANSILISIAAVIGATAITKEETWCPDSVVGIIPDPKQVDVRFLEYQLRALRPRLDGIEATQTAQKNINLQVLRPLPILLPSPERQKEIVKQMQAIESQLEKLRRRGAGAANLISSVISEMDQA